MMNLEAEIGCRIPRKVLRKTRILKTVNVEFAEGEARTDCVASTGWNGDLCSSKRNCSAEEIRFGTWAIWFLLRSELSRDLGSSGINRPAARHEGASAIPIILPEEKAQFARKRTLRSWKSPQAAAAATRARRREIKSGPAARGASTARTGCTNPQTESEFSSRSFPSRNIMSPSRAAIGIQARFSTRQQR